MNTKSDRLGEGEAALKNLDQAGRVSYEGGDGGPDTEWHSTFRVWPADGFEKEDVANSCEDTFVDGVVLSPSMTEKKHDYVWVTVRTI